MVCSDYKYSAICYLDALDRAEGIREDREKIFDFENHIFLRDFCQLDSNDKLHDSHAQLYNDVRSTHSFQKEIHVDAPYAKWVTRDLANVPNESFQAVKTKLPRKSMA